MKPLTNAIIRHRNIGLAIILLLTLFLGYEVTQIELNADFTTYLRQDDPIVQKFNLIGEEYAGKSMVLVMIETEDVFKGETLKMIRDLSDAYEGLEGIAYVTSLTNVLDFKKTEWGLEVGKLIPRKDVPISEEELARLKNYTLSKDMYVKDLVSEDGKSTVIALRIKHDASEIEVVKEIKNIAATIANQKAEDISFGGMPLIMDSMFLLIMDAAKRLVPIMAFLMFMVLLLGFRKAGGIIVPLLVVVFSVVWTVGLMSVFGISLNMLTGIMPVILFAMASADGIHIMRRYYEKKRLGLNPLDAIRETFSELAIAIIITTFTTIIGFSSLLISNFSAIQQFGLVTSLGVFIALLVTFLLIPVLITFVKPATEERGSSEPSRKILLTERWAELVHKNSKTILALSGIVVVISLIIIPRIKKDVDFSLCLEKGSKPHRAEMILRRDFGGTLPVQALVNGDIKDPATLKAMRYLERYLDAVPAVGEVQSMAGVISEMNDVMNDRYIIPETREGVANLWFMLEGKDMVEQMVREDNKEALIQSRLDTWDTGVMATAMDSIEDFIKALPEKVYIVDLAKVPAKERGRLVEIKNTRITDNLMLDMAGNRIQTDRNQVREIVKTALLKKGIEESGYDTLRERVTEYLRGDDAEVEAISEETAAGIAKELEQEIRGVGYIRPEKIGAMVRSNLMEHEEEDVRELAESLEMVTKEALGTARVAVALGKIKNLLPPDAEGARNLFRNLKGTLWAMNEDVIALSVDEFDALKPSIKSSAVKELPISFENAGLSAVLMRMERELIPSQVTSLIVAFIMVFVAMGFIFRSPTIGLISIIPIGLTILINFAVMGYFKIGLDSFTAMIASVALGLGIDFNVHFISCFKREFSEMGDELEALKKTLSTTGVAILINALTVGLGFAVLLLAGGQHMRRFGGLVALTVILSAIFSFTLLPAIVMLFKSKFQRKEQRV